MVCSRGYSVNLWVKLIMVQMENIEFMIFQTLKLVSDIGLYEFCFWNVASHHGTSYIINSGMQLHIWKWDLGFIHFQPLFGGKWVKSSLNYREKIKKKKRDHSLTHTTHPCPGWGRSSLRGNKVRVWRSNWPQPLYPLVCSFFPTFLSLLGFHVMVLRVSDLRFSFGGILPLENQGSHIFTIFRPKGKTCWWELSPPCVWQ